MPGSAPQISTSWSIEEEEEEAEEECSAGAMSAPV